MSQVSEDQQQAKERPIWKRTLRPGEFVTLTDLSGRPLVLRADDHERLCVAVWPPKEALTGGVS